MVAARVENEGESEGRKRIKISSYQWISSGDLMYGMVTIVNNAILYTWKLLREYLKTSHHTHNKT